MNGMNKKKRGEKSRFTTVMSLCKSSKGVVRKVFLQGEDRVGLFRANMKSEHSTDARTDIRKFRSRKMKKQSVGLQPTKKIFRNNISYVCIKMLLKLLK